MVNSDTDPSLILAIVVNTVGNYFAELFVSMRHAS